MTAIEDEYRALETEAIHGETDVLGFTPSNPIPVSDEVNIFEGKDADQFDEPDFKVKEKHLVLCFVKRVLRKGRPPYTSAVLTIFTPAGKTYDVKLPARAYQPIAEKSFCILRLIQDKVALVVSTNE